jgi:two-component system OmpR family response regulator
VRILIVEDEPEIAGLLRDHLVRQGFVADAVESLGDAEEAIACAPFDLILLDRRLPDGDGLALLPVCRKAQPACPVIVLTALDRIDQRISGLDSGADDYVAKPFDIDELMARIRAVLRRKSAGASPVICFGAISFDPVTRAVAIRQQPMILPRRELALLESLISRAGRVVPRDVLINEMFSFEDEIQSNTLDAHVSRLRAKLVANDAGVAVHPIRGIGYLLDLTADTPLAGPA